VKSTRHIILQPWLPDGSPRERIAVDLPAGRTTEVRVDMNLERIDIGWMQLVTDRGNPFKIEQAYEWLDGNTLKTESQPPFDPMRASPRASRNVADLFQAGDQLVLIVMNVSGHSIEVGACDQDYLDCFPLSRRAVMPQSTAAIPIPNPHLRYVAAESSGASACAVLDIRNLGLSIQAFGADSTIRYSPVK
jgi:hypothetical protein